MSPMNIELSAENSNGSSSGIIGTAQLEGLLRIPWVIEVKVLFPTGFSESLKLDCYLGNTIFYISLTY